MSHFSEIKTQIKNRELLKDSLTELGWALETSPNGVKVRGYLGATYDAEFKVLTDTHYDIGFRRNESGNYEMVGDWEILPKIIGQDQNALINQIKRNYAKNTVIDMAKQQGYSIECIETAGALEMVVTE